MERYRSRTSGIVHQATEYPDLATALIVASHRCGKQCNTWEPSNDGTAVLSDSNSDFVFFSLSIFEILLWDQGSTSGQCQYS